MMRPVSEAFLRTLAGSHRMTARARVCTTFQTGTNPTGTDVGILDGNVIADAAADVRSTLDLVVDGTNAWPADSSALLGPWGNELFIERGITYGNGSTEWVSLGYFKIMNVEQDYPDFPIRLTGHDRMRGIIDARLEAPRQYAAGTTVGTIFTQLVGDVYPAATIDYDDGTTTSGSTLARGSIAEQDRHGFLKDLAASRGKIIYWDYRGRLQVKSPPASSSPVWDVAHGAGGVLVSMGRQLSREGVFNAVIAFGEGADTVAPVTAVVRDNNPASATYYYGPFGKVPRFYSSPFITTTAQAISAGTAILRQSLGLPYAIDFVAVPNPALEPLDPVRVRYSHRAAAEVHVIQAITIPLVAAEPVTASTREQTAELLEVA